MYRSSLILMFSLAVGFGVGCVGESPLPVEDSASDGGDSFNSAPTPPSVADETATTDLAMAKNAVPSSSDNSSSSVEPTTSLEPEGQRTSIVGNWEFLICGSGADILGMLVRVDEQDGKYSFRIIDDSQAMAGWTVESADVTAKDIHIKLMTPAKTPIDFQGTFFDDGVVRGNVAFGQGGQQLVRWSPTSMTALHGSQRRVPSLGIEQLQTFQPDPQDQIGSLREKAVELGMSNLAFEVCRQITMFYRMERLPESKFDGMPELYQQVAAPWGDRVVAQANLELAFTMTTCEYSPQRARDFLKLAIQSFGDDFGGPSASLAKLTEGLLDLRSDDEGVQQSGLAVLQEMREQDPQNLNASVAIAEFYRKTGKLEEALDIFAGIAATPSGMGTMKPVVELWKELGRPATELDTYIDEVFRKQAYAFAETPIEVPEVEGNRQVALAELYTGSSCPPCVAADIATGAVEQSLPPSAFIMLRFHQHIPAPDPLATLVGMQRGGYYGIQGTPTIMLNGKPVDMANGLNGSYANAPTGYEYFGNVVKQAMLLTTPLVIDLKATGDGTKIDIEVDVTGVEVLPDILKLRLCIVEDEVSFAAPNGIRLHEMVVRSMPGGLQGIEVQEGQLSYEGSVTTEEIAAEIRGFISQIPSLKLPKLELDKLSVVAFVQSDEDGQILQAVVVPVEGLTPLPPLADEPVEGPAAPQDEPASSSEEKEGKAMTEEEQAAAKDSGDTAPSAKKSSEKPTDEKPAEEKTSDQPSTEAPAKTEAPVETETPTEESESTDPAAE